MDILLYYLHTALTLPLLYCINVSMLEIRCSKKQTYCIVILGLFCSAILDGLLFLKKIDVVSIYSYGVITTVIPSFICLFIISKRRDISFFFTFLTEIVLTAITTSLSYLIAYVLPFNFTVTEILIHIALLLFLCAVNKFYLSEQYKEAVAHYPVHWGYYLPIPVSFLIIWAMFIEFTSQYKDTTHKIIVPYMNYIYEENIPILLFLLGISFYIILLLLSVIIKNYSYFLKREENSALQFQITSLKKLLKNYEDNNNKLQIFRHDMRHHLNTLMMLLKNNDVSNALSYLKAISGDLETTKTIRFSKNSILNCLLSFYHEEFQKSKIKFDCTIQVRESLFLTKFETEIGAVISNILENALHAVNNIPNHTNQTVRFQFIEHNKQYLITCENAYFNKVILNDKHHPISLRQGHGLGTRSILAFEKKMQATVTYKIDSNKFCINILFYNQLDP